MTDLTIVINPYSYNGFALDSSVSEDDMQPDSPPSKRHLSLRNWLLANETAFKDRRRWDFAGVWKPDYEIFRQELLYHTVQCFEHHHGSLPADYVRSAMQRDHLILYEVVVRDIHNGRWYNFLALLRSCVCAKRHNDAKKNDHAMILQGHVT